MLDGMTCLYKTSVDLFFYVIGSGHENELLLMSVLDCLYDSVSNILRKSVEKKALTSNLEFILLAIDEMIDGGIIMEEDPLQVFYLLININIIIVIVILDNIQSMS